MVISDPSLQRKMKQLLLSQQSVPQHKLASSCVAISYIGVSSRTFYTLDLSKLWQWEQDIMDFLEGLVELSLLDSGDIVEDKKAPDKVSVLYNKILDRRSLQIYFCLQVLLEEF